jgi:hypothetical protein
MRQASATEKPSGPFFLDQMPHGLRKLLSQIAVVILFPPSVSRTCRRRWRPRWWTQPAERVVWGTEALPVRVHLGDVLRADPAAIRDMALTPPSRAAARAAGGGLPGMPLSAVAEMRLDPVEGTVPRRSGDRANTVEAFLPPRRETPRPWWAW